MLDYRTVEVIATSLVEKTAGTKRVASTTLNLILHKDSLTKNNNLVRICVNLLTSSAAKISQSRCRNQGILTVPYRTNFWRQKCWKSRTMPKTLSSETFFVLSDKLFYWDASVSPVKLSPLPEEILLGSVGQSVEINL